MPTSTFTCATCDHEIAGRPVFHIGLTFCCPGCAADGPCMCSYDPVDDPKEAFELVDPDEVPVDEPVGGRVFVEPPAREPVTALAAARDDTERLVGAAR
jgi:hypothetical protein